jgi:hypothetical protein
LGDEAPCKRSKRARAGQDLRQDKHTWRAAARVFLTMSFNITGIFSRLKRKNKKKGNVTVESANALIQKAGRQGLLINPSM